MTITQLVYDNISCKHIYTTIKPYSSITITITTTIHHVSHHNPQEDQVHTTPHRDGHRTRKPLFRPRFRCRRLPAQHILPQQRRRIQRPPSQHQDSKHQAQANGLTVAVLLTNPFPPHHVSHHNPQEDQVHTTPHRDGHRTPNLYFAIQMPRLPAQHILPQQRRRIQRPPSQHQDSKHQAQANGLTVAVLLTNPFPLPPPRPEP